MSKSFARKIKHLVEPLYKKIYRWCISLFYYLPIKKNKIVFIQGEGGGYRCNLKYVAEEIHRQNLPYDLVWLVESMDTKIPPFIRKVKYNRICAVYELATAHVFINNSKALYPVKKKQGQSFIYIPHGQPGCKCAEGDANLPEAWVRNSKQHSALTDVFISMGSYHTQVLKDTFWVPEHAQIWEIGFPRNDIYYRDTAEKQKEIRQKLHVPDGTKIVLYAPTFRDNGTTEAYDLDMHRILRCLENKTGSSWLFFVTLHGCFKWFKKPPYQFGERVWDMSGYEDIHELLLVVDVVISDYSSVSLDFANMRRPVFLYASDIDKYTEMRGLKPMFYQLPFPLCRTNDELEAAIMNYDKDNYQNRLNEFAIIYGSVDDDYASKRFTTKLVDLMERQIV